MTAAPARSGRRRRLDPVTVRSLVLLYLTVQLPLLFTAPGRVVSDVSPIMLLAPGRALGRAVTAWDTHLGLGAVPRSGVGDLWPVGPWFWAMDQLRVPDWLAQRLWWGAILFAAGAGVLFLARTWRWRPEAGATAAFVYALSPYVVTLVTQDSPSLLAFAGQPWLLALAIRALRTPGWRHPSIFALAVATVGAADPGGLLVISAAPAGWLAFAVMRSTVVTRAGAAWTAAKMTLVSAAVNLWWILGLSVEGTNGTPAHPYDREPELVASTSTATEVLRGLGDWSFYATEQGSAALRSSVHYTQSIALIVATFALAAAGLLGLGVARWRHRVFAIGLLVVGVVVAVGAHPWDSPSPLGALIKLGIESDLPFALRSPSRAVPLIALAIALGVGALVGASLEESRRRGVVAAVLAAILAVAALPPLWLGDFVPDGLDRPQHLPGYWDEVAAALDDDGDSRILEVPAVEQPAYRGRRGPGSVLTAIVDRPVATRGRLPQGSAPAADLLRAIDTELARGTLDASALAPVARLLGAGDIVVRNDAGDARARAVWATVVGAPGLGEPEGFGPESSTGDGTTPAVGVVPVDRPEALVRATVADRVVLLSGDGTGILDAAAAGLLDGTELVRHSATVTADPDFARSGLRDQRLLVVTDTNRARAERWDRLYDTLGFTEQASGGPLRADPADERLDVFDDRPGTQSVAEHRGIAARATAYGDTDRYTPHQRPVHAVDGDPETAWRVGTGRTAVGERLELTSSEAIETDSIRFVQATGVVDDRRITEIELRFDGGDPVPVSLDQRSLSAPGQTVDIDQRAFETMDIEITGVEGQGAAGVGFSVVDLGVAPTREYVRMPEDLLDAGGFRTRRYPLALVQTRLRSPSPADPDEEPTIARIVDLPTARTYRLTGAARLSADAGSQVLDQLTGRRGDVTVTASTVGGGRLDRLPSNVLDGDPDTVWTAGTGDSLPTITLDADTIRPVPSIEVHLEAEEGHALPTELAITVDGRDLGRVAVPPGERIVTADLPPAVVGAQVELTFLGLDDPSTEAATDATSSPLTVSDIVVPDWVVGPRAETIDTGCRNDLVFVDDVGVPVRAVGDTAAALRGDPLSLTSCDAEPVRLPGGERRFDGAPGARTGIDVDRVVWCSAAGGAACPEDGPVSASGDPTPQVEVVASDDATVRVEVRGASPGTPFWLVLGQSFQRGWEIIDTDVEHSDSQLVDGYANGFLVTPDAETLELTVRFVPQNRVEIGLLLSLVGVIVALGLAIASGTVGRPVPIPLQEPLRRIRALTWEGALPTRRDALVVGVTGGIVAGLVVEPVIGLGVGILAGFATRRQGWRGAFTLAPALLLAACAVYVVGTQVRDETPSGPDWPASTADLHTVALVAVVLLVVDLVIDRMWERRSDFR